MYQHIDASCVGVGEHPDLARRIGKILEFHPVGLGFIPFQFAV